MKILAIGDPHFKVNNVEETDQMTEKIVQLIKENSPDFVVVLGDILDRHESIHVNPLARATEFLRSIAEISPLYVLIGNHDRPNNSTFLTEVHPFTALTHWPNTTIVDTVKTTIVNGYSLIFVPYVPNGRFVEALGDLRWKEAKTIFAHQEFKGAKMGAVISTEGDQWETNWPLVISGHIHDFDQLQENIYYAGTPIQHAFGDREDKTLLWLEYQEENISISRIDLGLPKKILVYLTPERALKWKPVPGQKTKVVLTGPTSVLARLMKTDQVKQWIQNGVKVVRRDQPEDRQISISTGIKFRQMLSEQCDREGLTWLLEEVTRM